MRVLAISAHPDDETMFAGGMLAKLAREGNELYILVSTRGEGGEVGEPPVGPKERLGEYREAEMRCAARALGARDVFFLDYVDPHMEIDGEARAIEARRVAAGAAGAVALHAHPLEEPPAGIGSRGDADGPGTRTHGTRSQHAAVAPALMAMSQFSPVRS